MKKILKLSLAGLGGVVAIVGAGLVGGTYNQFKNYQALSTFANDSTSIWKNDETAFDYLFPQNSSGGSSYPSSYPYSYSTILPYWWNKTLWTTTTSNGTSSVVNASNLISYYNKMTPVDDSSASSLNSSLYNQYPSFDDFYKYYTSSTSSSGTSSSGTTLTKAQLEDVYKLMVDMSNLDVRYNADQGGVIAGSVLLAAGLIVLIVFLVLALKKDKVFEVQPQPEEPQVTE